MAGKLDARAKLVAALIAIFAISSTPAGAWKAFAAYATAVLILIAISGVSLRAILARVAVGLPFVLVAGALMWLAESWQRALSVGLKGTFALALLSLLILTSEVSALVGAIRKLGAPKSINLIASMMLRYIQMLSDEFGRMSRARAARCGGPLAGVALFQVHSNQAGLLLVRSWERAERIHNAMLARGFTGVMPELRQTHFGARDALFLLVVTAVFAGARLLLLN